MSSLQHHATTTESVILRLFDAEAESDGRGLSPSISLWEFYRRYFLPEYLEVRGAADRSRRQYEETLQFWREYTGDPPLVEIDQRTCGQFVRALNGRLWRGKPLSPNTVRKHCRHLQVIFDRTGPRSRHNRLGAELLDSPPWLEMPPPREKLPEDSFTIEEITAWLAACDVAVTPRRMHVIKPADFWRALVRWIYNVGTRIDTTMRLEYPMIRGNWLVVPPAIMKRHAARRFWVNDAAMAAVDAIRTHRTRIFPWPNWPRSQNWLQKTRRLILAAAGIPPQRRWGFHGLRKAMASQVALIDRRVAQSMMGHTTWEMTAGCYVHPDTIGPVMDRLPQP